MIGLRPWLQLCRVEYAAFGYVALLGALAVRGSALPASLAALLLFSNVLFVCWTFAHNDLCDVDVDRKNAELEDRVLVRGALSRRAVSRFVLVTCGLSLAAPLLLLPDARAVAWLLLATVLAMVYDVVSKRVLGADLLFAASAASLALFGAVAAGGNSRAALLVAAIVFVEHLFFNAIEGGLKDVVSDRAAGVDTVAGRLVAVDGESLAPSLAFRALALALKTTSAALAFAIVDHGSTAQWILLAFVVASGLGFSAKLTSMRRYDWPAMARLLIPIEMASRSLIPVALADRIGWGWVAALFGVPAIWYLSLARAVHAREQLVPRRF